MVDAWTIAASVVGSLLAVALGSAATMLAQKREWDRQKAVRWDSARREVYSKFLGMCSAYFIALCDVARPMRNTEAVAKVDSKYAVAEGIRIEVTSLRGEVDMLAQQQTRLAALGLFNYLKQTNTDLDSAHEKYAKHQVRPTEVKEYLEYEQGYSDMERSFLSAASFELHIEKLTPEQTRRPSPTA